MELCQLCSSPIPKPCRCKTGTSRPEAAWRIFGLPSGKHSHDYGNSQFSTGKSKYFYGSFSSLPEGTPFVVDFPIENGLQTGPLVLQRAPPPDHGILQVSRSQGQTWRIWQPPGKDYEPFFPATVGDLGSKFRRHGIEMTHEI